VLAVRLPIARCIGCVRRVLVRLRATTQALPRRRGSAEVLVQRLRQLRHDNTNGPPETWPEM
jgi:hypothetical protein